MVTLVRAPNASAMTLSGTNSYVLDCGRGTALVIDPGPAIASHLAAIVAAAQSRDLAIRAIALTHGHPDHALGSPGLAARTGAPVYAHPACRAPHDRDLPLEDDLLVGVTALRVADAPGHTFDHVVLYLPRERALFTGDTILGEGTAVIAPPGGALRPYEKTLQRLARDFADAESIYPGHGPRVADAQTKIAEYVQHRRMREEQIVRALRDGPATIPRIVRNVYGPARSVLWPAMARQVLAHLIALEEERRVAARPLDRAMQPDEAAMLNPRIEEILAPGEAAVAIAELGTEMRLERLYEYRLLEERDAS
ncbi:MAG: MBL fold metallo-hydrolase [Candidatus Eremiobacteraeota bacterium]|nr:MBL fold metallo-hydrolase [Candidatus Eremiobacteraeota bacterium]